MRGLPNPLLRIGQNDYGNRENETVWALKDVDFTVEQGEVIGIIGRNGAGKSTLLKILSRVTAPTSGRVRVKGRIAGLLEVGTGFHPDLTGRENVYLNGAILGMTNEEVRKKFDEIVAFADVEQFIDTPVKRYSSGMYVRLAFAVAAHLEPEILVVDEVLAVGDLEFQKKCLGKMSEVSRQGRTVLFVSHNMGSIKSLCHEAVLLERGQLVSKGKVGEIVDAYMQRGANKTAFYEIPKDAPRLGNGQARIRTVQLTSLSGEPTTTLYLGQSFKVIMTFDLLIDAKDAILEIGVITLDGSQIIQSFSTDNGQAPYSLDKGSYMAQIKFKMTLLPRSYALFLSMHHATNGVTMDEIERSIDFNVMNAPEHGNNHYRWETRGYIRPDANWQVTPESGIGDDVISIKKIINKGNYGVQSK